MAWLGHKWEALSQAMEMSPDPVTRCVFSVSDKEASSCLWFFHASVMDVINKSNGGHSVLNNSTTFISVFLIHPLM